MKLLYKLLVTSMITITLSFFVVTSFAQASRFTDLINDDGFYYTGTQKGELIAPNSLFDKIINFLSQIAKYIIGLIGLAIRGIGIGWIEIAEMILTAILEADSGFFEFFDNLMGNYSQNIVNVENIIFNKVEILNANIFTNTPKKDLITNKKLAKIIKLEVAKWYFILRLISIAFMLILLIFIGIKMLLSTIASEKAVYKQMLVDWVVGMIIVFSIHYIMIAIFSINDAIVSALEPLAKTGMIDLKEEYEYGLESEVETSEMETTLYESARTKAYSLNWSDGFAGMMIYGVLVYYAWRFSILYFIRLFNIVILTIVAPVVATSYAINKVLTGKAKVFSGWLNEYIMTVGIQIFHVIIYVTFLPIALELAMESILGSILAFAFLKFMIQADKILRQLFKMSGGKGSMAGDMENTGFGEIKSAAKNLGNAVVGGQVGIAAAKATYGIATKPARVAAESIFAKSMAKKANQADEEKKQKMDEMAVLEKEKIENIEKIRKAQAERNGLRKKGGNNKNQPKSKREKELQKEIDFYEERNENIDDEIKYRKHMQHLSDLNDAFYEKTFKGGIANLFDSSNYVEKGTRWHIEPLRDSSGNLVLDANGKKIRKYNDGKYHKIKTKRKDGVNLAFWRKKTDSVGTRFAKNLKLKKILGISDASSKELKKEFNFWKSTMLGVFSAIAGWPALALNPTLGMALLANSVNSTAKFISRARKLKNRPDYKKDKRYTFSNFSKQAQLTMQLELEREIREAQRKLARRKAKRHPKLARKILNNESIRYRGYINAKVKLGRYLSRPSGISTIQQEKMLAITEKEFVKHFKNELKELNEIRTQDLASEYRKKMTEEEEEQKDKAKQKSERELLFADKATDNDVAQVGDKLFQIHFKDELQTKEDIVLNRIENISNNPTISKEDRIKNIKNEIKQNRDELIKNQMTKYFSDNGVVDITKTTLNDSDIMKIKKGLIRILEEKGVIKKGEIALEDELVSSKNVHDVYSELSTQRLATNKRLEEKMAISSTLEFIEKNGIQDMRILATDEAQEGIYSIIKDKMMSEDTKKSISVIEKITGKSNAKDNSELSEYLKQSVEASIDSADEVEVISGSQDKKRLVEKETNRNINKTKSKLEKAILSDSSENIDNQKELDMLFLLSELGQKNIEADKLGKKSKKVTKEMREQIEYYQGRPSEYRDGSKRVNSGTVGVWDTSKDGSKRFDPNKDGSQRVIDDIKVNGIAKIVHGPSQDILDLINDI